MNAIVKLTSLADTIRNRTGKISKYTVDEMKDALENQEILLTSFPNIESSDSKHSVKDGNAQTFKVDSDNQDYNLYLTNWAQEQFYARADDIITQSFVVETDGNVNSISLRVYEAGRGQQGILQKDYLVPIAKGKYWASSTNKVTKEGFVEYFNFFITYSGATYLKFSQPFVAIDRKLGGVIRSLLTTVTSRTEVAA